MRQRVLQLAMTGAVLLTLLPFAETAQAGNTPTIAMSNPANPGAVADAYLHGYCSALAFRHQIMV